jgi:pimeloyl-ACP methyl ester carboxylesterase
MSDCHHRSSQYGGRISRTYDYDLHYVVLLKIMKLKQKLSIRYARARLNILSLVSTRKAAIKAFRLFCTPQSRLAGKDPAVFEKGERLSFRVEGHTVRGHRWLPIQFRTEESRLSKPAKKVLLAHGFESSSQTFDGYITAFLKKGYEVVAFDAPAHGRSGGRRILLTQYVKMLSDINRNFGPFQSYLGHSLGGLALALSLEDGLAETGSRLVLIAPAVETTEALHNFSALLHLSPEVNREMGDYAREITGRPLAWFSLRRALGQVQADILYFQDEEDRVVPLKAAQRVQKDGHPHIRFVFTRGLGHRKINKDPEIIDRAVGFL